MGDILKRMLSGLDADELLRLKHLVDDALHVAYLGRVTIPPAPKIAPKIIPKIAPKIIPKIAPKVIPKISPHVMTPDSEANADVGKSDANAEDCIDNGR